MIVWIVNSLFLSIWCFVLLRWRVPSSLRPFLIPGMVFKIIAGILLGLLYQFYYKEEGDTFFLFNLASYLSELLPGRPKDFFNILLFNDFDAESKTFFFVWNQPRALFFVKILALINSITQSNYWLTSVYMSLFSFTGLWYLSSFLVKSYDIPGYLAALAFLLFPSFVFWSSGVLKESIMTGLIGILLVSVLKLLRPDPGYRLLNILLATISFIILLQLKYYYAGIIGASLLAYCFTKIVIRMQPGNIAIPPAFLLLFFLAAGFGLATLLHPNMNISSFPEALYTNYTATLTKSADPDYLITDFKPAWTSILLNSPQALYQGLLGPGIWSVQTTIQIPAALENLFLLVLITVIILYRIYIGDWKLSTEGLIILIYVVVSATFMAYASPNFGSLIRYKTGYLPFLILLAGYRNPIIGYFFSGSEIRRQERQSGSDTAPVKEKNIIK